MPRGRPTARGILERYPSRFCGQLPLDAMWGQPVSMGQPLSSHLQVQPGYGMQVVMPPQQAHQHLFHFAGHPLDHPGPCHYGQGGAVATGMHLSATGSCGYMTAPTHSQGCQVPQISHSTSVLPPTHMPMEMSGAARAVYQVCPRWSQPHASCECRVRGRSRTPDRLRFKDDGHERVSTSYRFLGGVWKRNPRTVLPRKVRASMLTAFNPELYTPVLLAGKPEEVIDELLFIVGGLTPATRIVDLQRERKRDVREMFIKEAVRMQRICPTRLSTLAGDLENTAVVAMHLGAPMEEMLPSRRLQRGQCLSLPTETLSVLAPTLGTGAAVAPSAPPSPTSAPVAAAADVEAQQLGFRDTALALVPAAFPTRALGAVLGQRERSQHQLEDTVRPSIPSGAVLGGGASAPMSTEERSILASPAADEIPQGNLRRGCGDARLAVLRTPTVPDPRAVEQEMPKLAMLPAAPSSESSTGCNLGAQMSPAVLAAVRQMMVFFAQNPNIDGHVDSKHEHGGPLALHDADPADGQKPAACAGKLDATIATQLGDGQIVDASSSGQGRSSSEKALDELERLGALAQEAEQSAKTAFECVGHGNV